MEKIGSLSFAISALELERLSRKDGVDNFTFLVDVFKKDENILGKMAILEETGKRLVDIRNPILIKSEEA